MTLVIKSSSEDTISLPDWLMTVLDLREGDEVKTIVEGRTLHLTPLDQFLALRGALREDESFDAAIEFLDKAWSSWTIPDSA
jgi:antitoxin component of MazEF toxin-antitoxin module